MHVMTRGRGIAETKTRNEILDGRFTCVNGRIPLCLLEMFYRKCIRIDHVLEERAQR